MYRFQNTTFNPENGILEVDGEQLILRPKTAQILQILIQHQHELVTKDRLLETVWPDCHVSSGSLVQSIQEIRRALGDSAKEPKFIQTFPRRGYQWLVPVTETEEKLIPLEGSPQQLDVLVPSRPQPPEPSSAVTRSNKKRLWLTFATIAAAGIWMGWQIWQEDPKTEPPLAKLRLAVLPIADETDNPSLEWMAPGIHEMLSDRLQETEQIQLLSSVRMHDAISRAGMGASPFANNQAQKLLKQIEGQMLLQSSIQLDGSQFRYKYRLTKVDQGTAEGSFSFSNPLDLSTKIARLLSAYPAPDQKGIRYSSVDVANQDYFRGKLALETKSAPLAKRYFEAALLQDSQFDTCRLALGWTLYLMGRLHEAKTHYQTVLTNSKVTANDYDHIVSLQGLARIEWRLGEMTRSNQRLEEALSLARNLGFPRLEARSLRLLAWHAIHVGDWKKHDEFEGLARKIASNFSDEKNNADELYYIGSSESPFQDYEQSRLLLLIARDYYEKAGSLSDLAFTYSALGKNRSCTAQQQEHYLLQAQELFENLGYQIMIPGIWEGLALCYAQKLEPQKFMQYLQAAHKTYEELEYWGDLANTQFLQGVAEIMIGLSQKDAPLQDFLERAEYWLEQCHAFHAKHEIYSRQGSVFLLRGMIAMERDDLKTAQSYISKASDVFQSLDYPEGIAICAVSNAALALKRSQWQQALVWSTRAEEVYPQRPGLWQPFAIHAHLQLGQLDTALKISESFKTSARPTAMNSAKALHAHCRRVLEGENAPLPSPPNILHAYFQSY